MGNHFSHFAIILGGIKQQFLPIPETKASSRPQPDKWSPKEIIGHLIDSAVNNHRRFVLAQLKDDLVFDGYDQNGWVSAQNYNNCSWQELVEFWYAYNKRILNVISNIPEEKLKAEQPVHNLDLITMKKIPADNPATLDYLIKDYYDHIEHHIKQINVLIGNR